MFCSKCGTDLPNDSRFCRSCGQTLGVVSTGGGAAAAPARYPEPDLKQTSWISKIALYILLLIVVLIATDFGLRFLQKSSHGAAQNTAQPLPRLQTQSTGDKGFTLSAGGTTYCKFDVPAGAFNVNLRGHFSARGGSGNDVEAFVITEDNYVNWMSGHSVPTLYYSGKVTQETLNLSLPADAATYYLVFSNRFSLLTPKAVEANVALTYYVR